MKCATTGSLLAAVARWPHFFLFSRTPPLEYAHSIPCRSRSALEAQGCCSEGDLRGGGLAVAKAERASLKGVNPLTLRRLERLSEPFLRGYPLQTPSEATPLRRSAGGRARVEFLRGGYTSEGSRPAEARCATHNLHMHTIVTYTCVAFTCVGPESASAS